jgi:hypothetical protein
MYTNKRERGNAGRRGDFHHEGHEDHEEFHGINLRVLALKGRQT